MYTHKYVILIDLIKKATSSVKYCFNHFKFFIKYCSNYYYILEKTVNFLFYLMTFYNFDYNHA